MKPVVGRDGSLTYTVADGGRVTDRADHIKVDRDTIAATLLALTLAAERFGDWPLAVTGTDAFKAQVAQVAALRGFGITFADPAMEAERQHHATAAHARQTEQLVQPGPAASREAVRPEVAAFIARRNDTRERVAAIQPHRAWTGADAGNATYHGRRQIADGIEAVLLDREGETLVMVVTPAQAARARHGTSGIPCGLTIAAASTITGRWNRILTRISSRNANKRIGDGSCRAAWLEKGGPLANLSSQPEDRLSCDWTECCGRCRLSGWCPSSPTPGTA